MRTPTTRVMPPRFLRRRAYPAILLATLALISLFSLVPSTAAAQPATADGVTVIGYGEAGAPAETASLQLLITRGDFYGGPPPRPRAGATPGAEERELIAPIVEGIVATGIDEANITLVISPILGSAAYGPGGPAIGRIDVTVDQPTLEGLNDLVAAVSVGAIDQDLALGQVGISYEVADCQALERAAREAAIADGRERAEMQAELLGVQIGPVIASADVPSVASPGFSYFDIPFAGGACAPPAPDAFLGGSEIAVTVPPFDPTAEPEVEVYARVSLTFAIAEG